MSVNSETKINDELDETIKAGNKLAEAAHYVQSNYDGIHRLRLALAEWYKVRANENGRGIKMNYIRETINALRDAIEAGKPMDSILERMIETSLNRIKDLESRSEPIAHGTRMQ